MLILVFIYFILFISFSASGSQHLTHGKAFNTLTDIAMMVLYQNCFLSTGIYLLTSFTNSFLSIWFELIVSIVLLHLYLRPLTLRNIFPLTKHF